MLTAHFWLSLSSNEGFHQVPVEAALCGCLILYYDVDSGGTRDYCNESTAIPFKDVDELYYILANPEFFAIGDLKGNMDIQLFDVIGSRETNMKRFWGLLL